MSHSDESRDPHVEPMSSVSFSLRPHHVEQLRLLSRQFGVSQSQLMRDALELALSAWLTTPPEEPETAPSTLSISGDGPRRSLV